MRVGEKHRQGVGHAAAKRVGAPTLHHGEEEGPIVCAAHRPLLHRFIAALARRSGGGSASFSSLPASGRHLGSGSRQTKRAGPL